MFGSMEMRLFWSSLQLGALPNGDQGESKVATLVCHFWNFSFPKNIKNLWQNILVLNLLSQKLQPNKSLGKWPMTISWFTLWNWPIHWSFLSFRAWKKMWVGLIQACKLNPYQCCQVIAFWTSPKDMNRESSF